MAYFIDLFSPETHEAFTRSPRDISGFRLRRNHAEKVKTGDIFVCYLTRLSRWFGLLDGTHVTEKPRERLHRGYYSQDLGWQVGTPQLSLETAHPCSITCCNMRRAR